MAVSRQWVVAAAGPVLAALAGCLAMDNRVHEAPTGTAVTAAATWQNFVLFGPDTVHEGKTIAGLAGRLYLFSSSDSLTTAAGKVEVRLYPDPPDPANPEAPLEVWRIDAETLKSRLQRDMMGWGYSLVLPWSTYRPELTHVRLTVRFDSTKGGMPLYAPETHLTLHGEGPPPISSTTTIPGVGRGAAPATTPKPAG
jgi:hypothetical protein